MRGKFITTSLKLAVLAGGKRSRLIPVKETKATLENFQPIWSKGSVVINFTKQKNVKGNLKMVF